MKRRILALLLAAASACSTLTPALASEPYVFTDREGNTQVVEDSEYSFATRVISTDHGTVWTSKTDSQDPNLVLGLPDPDQESYCLGAYGSITLEFEMYVVDGDGPDLYIFEDGAWQEATSVEVSNDLINWYYVGDVEGATSSIDLNGKIPEGSQFRYVRITDRDGRKGSWPGADLLAVAALNATKIQETDSVTPTIPNTAYTFRGHSYQYFTDAMTWAEAEAYCESLGGYLVTVTSQAEQTFLENYLQQTAGSNNYMIGLHRDLTGWETWVTGETVSYTNWGSNQPDDTHGTQTTGVIHIGDTLVGVGYTIDQGQWDDNYTDSYPFVCEWGEVTLSDETESSSNVALDDITISGNAYYDSENDCYVLTEEKTKQSGSIWFSQVRCNDNFSLSFDYYSGRSDYNDGYNGADGICVAFYASSELASKAGTGQNLGFSGCGGYGVELDTYYNSGIDPIKSNHVAFLNNTVSNHLSYADASAYTEDYQWHHMKIENRRGVCSVYVDGTLVLQQSDVTPSGYYEIGITASTGSGVNLHAVRNVELTEAIWTDSSAWADTELEQAQNLGLIPDSLYEADMTQPITRLEFAAVAVKVYENLSATQAIPAIYSPFTDCNDVEMLKAYNAGITNGTSATTFDPDTLLTREQAATMLARVFKRVTIPGWSLSVDSSYPLTYPAISVFADDAAISAWARNSVYFMAANGIIKGMGDNIFAPKNVTPQQEAMEYANATREQALIIAVRMVENLT